MDDDNITQDKMEDLLQKQEQSYVEALENIMKNKQEYLKAKDLYTPEISTLNKMMKINERAGNKYAVIRDEVQLKSYNLLRSQNQMIKNVLYALDYSNIKSFEEALNKIIAKNQAQVQKIAKVDYKPILDIGSDNTLSKAKENIKEFYALLEINKDIVNHLYSFEKRMYRLNKYSKYHLISVVLFINHSSIGKMLNPVLENYDLSIAKILFILFISVVFYVIRRYVYEWAQKYFIRIGVLEKYSKTIMQKLKKPFSMLIIAVNIEFAIYIYNDFIREDVLNKIFNITYSLIFVWMIYKILNAIVNIKIQEIDKSNKKIKNEMINVGNKIVNFLIVIIGLLLILYFAGVDLTAVLSGLGIGGLAVALAAKETLSNFFGTLSILLSDVFSQGDWIVIESEEGVVIEIGLRVTTLRTFDNALIAIPNSTLANKDVKNWSKRTLGRRIKMKIGVKYDSKPQDIKNAVNDIRNMLEEHPRIATKRTEYQHRLTNSHKLVSQDDLQGVKKDVLVYLDEFASSSINILVYCFSKSVNWEEWLETKEDVMHKIMEILQNNSLEFAFPSMSLYEETKHISKSED